MPETEERERLAQLDQIFHALIELLRQSQREAPVPHPNEIAREEKRQRSETTETAEADRS